MAELKTQKNEASVDEFLSQIDDEQKRQDSYAILEFMRAATGAPPKMWGTAIIGFGDTHYQYASGRQGDWFLTGFSPRKQNLTLYLMGGLEPHEALLQRLGKYKTGKGCLYIKRLADVDQDVLKTLIERSVATQKKSDS